MKVLLIKDVYKLGRAGDVKRVADGFGRNFLIPQGLAVLATPGAIKQVDYIREKASVQRAIINKEMGSIAEQLQKLSLVFPAKAGETGKLYGSITSQDVTDEIEKRSGIAIKRQQVDMQPLRSLGEHTIQIRLTMDLIPELKVLVYREGEAKPDPEKAFVEETVSDTSVVIEPATETIEVEEVSSKAIEVVEVDEVSSEAIEVVEVDEVSSEAIEVVEVDEQIKEPLEINDSDEVDELIETSDETQSEE